jgi:protein-S-isoprenylcysteine O-methyltransferase Ste14
MLVFNCSSFCFMWLGIFASMYSMHHVLEVPSEARRGREILWDGRWFLNHHGGYQETKVGPLEE